MYTVETNPLASDEDLAAAETFAKLLNGLSEAGREAVLERLHLESEFCWHCYRDKPWNKRCHCLNDE